MGTINYGTSKYITMGIEPVISYDQECTDFLEDNDYYNAKYILEEYSFYFFPVSLEYGYYEGFYFMIENNLPAVFDDDQEKADAVEEVKSMYTFLTDLAGVGIVSVLPGWCTAYRNYNDTLEDIKAAVLEMTEAIAATPVYQETEAETAIA